MSKNDEKSKKNFHKSDKNSSSFYSQLEEACKDLIYISETDAPVTPFIGNETREDHRSALKQLAAGSDGSISEVQFPQFFERLTTIKDWHGEREKTRAKKFLDLQKLIEENLTDLKVVRIGDVSIRIYAVGFDSEGRLLGITTNAVET
ncbi:MAG: nuclease A inhibitor family protein [Pyrinomonadaceae bacterium]